MSILSEPISITQTLFGKARQIADFKGFVTVSEETTDTLTITKQPVQQGAMITDHAFLNPATFATSILMNENSGKNLDELYKALRDLQSSRVPFTIITPKRTYTNMLMGTIGQTTDKKTEKILALRIACEEIIIVSVTTVQVPRRAQKNPGTTGKTEQAGKKSALLTGFQGISALFTGGVP